MLALGRLSRYGIAIVALAATLAILTHALNRSDGTRVEYGTVWTGGRKDRSEENSIWIAFSQLDPYSMVVYRDNDDDGLVDEVLVIVCGDVVGVHIDTDRDGLLDTAYDFTADERDHPVRGSIPKGSPEAGPFRRDEMDRNSRTHPVPRYSHLQSSPGTER